MRVGIDVTAAIYDRGVSRYTTNLVRALARKPGVELRLYGASWRQKQRLTHFVSQVIKIDPDRHAGRVQALPPKIQEILWNTVRQNHIKKVFPDLEVFHSWDWIQPPDQNLPIVSTVHDLAILKFPATAHPKILSMHQRSWEELRKKRAQLIAVSQATKKDIVSLLHFDPKDVHVVYEALPLESVASGQGITEEKHEAVKAKLKLDRPYILCVGTREPRKNLRNAIEAWWPLRKEVELVIAGEAGWDNTAKLAEVLRSPQLRFLGKVSDQELAVLYAESELLLYPSLYEGFGLPILEAFYFGTPVVTSNISAMPEVAGNAAELVDPASVESIRQGIKNILHEENDAQRIRLQKMVLRLQLFSWQRVADETAKVYRRAAEAYEQT